MCARRKYEKIAAQKTTPRTFTDAGRCQFYLPLQQEQVPSPSPQLPPQPSQQHDALSSIIMDVFLLLVALPI